MKEVVHSNISKPDEFNHIILGTQCLDSQDDSHQISNRGSKAGRSCGGHLC